MTSDLDTKASLMRVTRFATADDQEEHIVSGTMRELIGLVLATAPDAQAGLLLRVTHPDRTEEHDLDAIRELAARPDYTGATGAWDTAERPDDPDRAYVDDPLAASGPGGRPADPPAPSEVP